MKFANIAEFAVYLWADAISAAQIVVLKCLYGLPLDSAERAIWRRYSGMRIFARYTPREFREAVLLIGRQAGKSSQLGTTITLWESICVERSIPEGDRWTALILTPILRQSTFAKAAEKMRSIPELASLIEVDCESDGLLQLANRVDIQAVAAIPAHARGPTAFLVLFDETAFFRQDKDFVANLPDLIEAVAPSLITTRGKLFMLSSPGGKAGVLFDAWEKRNENPDVFVFKAPSLALNPKIDPKLLAKERKRGESYYQREFLAEFTDSLNPFLPEEPLAAAVQRSVAEIPLDPKDYLVFGAVDTADKKDSNAMAIATVRDFSGVRKVVVLKTKEWRPGPNGHNVLKILEEVGGIFRSYRVGQARGDQKNMSACENIFGRYGVAFERVITEGQGSEGAYRTFLALLNDGRLVLPDDDTLNSQLRRLEERTSDGNRFLVQGRRNSKDDVAVAAVTAVALASEHLEVCEPMFETLALDDPGDAPHLWAKIK